MKRLIKNLLFGIADLIGLNHLFRLFTAGKHRALMYHGVSAEGLPTFYWTHLALSEFEWQMQYVKKHFHVMRTSDLLVELEQGGVTHSPSVVITFDDGLANVHSEAWPVLKRMGIPAVCFVLPSLSEGNQMIWPNLVYRAVLGSANSRADLEKLGIENIAEGFFDKDPGALAARLSQKLKTLPHHERQHFLAGLNAPSEQFEKPLTSQLRLMTPAEIEELAKSEEFEIAFHGSRHPILSTMSADEQRQDIARAIEDLGNWSIPTIPVFAYPNGRPEDFNEDTVKILRDLGFRAAFTTEDGLIDDNDDRFRLKRIAVGADTSRSEFKARVSGLFYFLSSPGRRGY